MADLAKDICAVVGHEWRTISSMDGWSGPHAKMCIRCHDFKIDIETTK